MRKRPKPAVIVGGAQQTWGDETSLETMAKFVWYRSGRVSGALLFTPEMSGHITRALNSSPLFKRVQRRDYGRQASQLWMNTWQEPPQLADIVLELISRTGWTRASLATRMGVAVQAVTKIVTGQQKGLTAETRFRLTQILEDYPDLYEQFRHMKIPGVGRPPSIKRLY